MGKTVKNEKINIKKESAKKYLLKYIKELEIHFDLSEDETKDIIDNYIRKIQDNQQLPWLINNAVPTDTKEK